MISLIQFAEDFNNLLLFTKNIVTTYIYKYVKLQLYTFINT